MWQKVELHISTESHMEVHSPWKIHKCPSKGCGKTFKYSGTLKCHIEKLNQKEYKCPHYLHVTDFQHYLKDYITWNHGPVLVCEYFINSCDYTTHQRSSLNMHQTWCDYMPSTSSLSSLEDEDDDD